MENSINRVGVLALQGAVMPHYKHIVAAGGEPVNVKTNDDLKNIDRLIIPGGESSTFLKLINAFDMELPLGTFIKNNPVWGICAGCILLAKKVKNPSQKSFGAIPITVTRNAYGRQIDSYESMIDNYPVSFIRAPIIQSIEEGVEIKASHTYNSQTTPVWVVKDNIMATTFHPELTEDYPSPMHKYFLSL